MDWALLVEFVKAVAWPVVVGYLGYKVTKQIDLGAVFDRLKSGKIGPVELQLEAKQVPQLPPATTPQIPAVTGEANAKLEPITSNGTGVSGDKPPDQPPPEAPPPAPPAPVEAAPAAEPALVDYAPGGAIVNAWARFEDVLRRESERVGTNRGVLKVNGRAFPFRPTELLEELRDNYLIDADTVAVANQLRVIRNEVVHPGKDGVRIPTVDAAQRYVKTIEDLIARVAEAADRKTRLNQLLDALHNPPPSVIRVSPLTASGVGSTPDAALAIAQNRRGNWGARAFGTIMMISQEDASLLLGYGATLVRNIEDDDDGTHPLPSSGTPVRKD